MNCTKIPNLHCPSTSIESKEWETKAVTIGDLIHRVVSSCLSNRLPSHYTLNDSGDTDLDDDDDPFVDFADAVSGAKECRRSPSAVAATEEEEEEKKRKVAAVAKGAERPRDAEVLMAEVFDAVSGVRRAYAALQGAHCPWDPDKMRAAVVAELRHLARLCDRFRCSASKRSSRGVGCEEGAEAELEEGGEAGVAGVDDGGEPGKDAADVKEKLAQGG